MKQDDERRLGILVSQVEVGTDVESIAGGEGDRLMGARFLGRDLGDHGKGDRGEAQEHVDSRLGDAWAVRARALDTLACSRADPTCLRHNYRMPSIPERSVSRYSGQYAQCKDPAQLLELLQDSMRTALEAKVEETAQSRFELALECYHQLRTLGIPTRFEGELDEHMEEFVRRFPAKWRSNVAEALVEHAGKLTRSESRLRLLREAVAVLSVDPAADDVDSTAIEPFRQQLERQVQALDGGGSAAAPMELVPTGTAGGEDLLPAGLQEDWQEQLDQATEAQWSEVEEQGEGHGIELGVISRLHLSLLDNQVPLVHTCLVTNESRQDLHACRLEVSSPTGLVETIHVDIGLLRAGGSIEVGSASLPCPLMLRREQFTKLTERVSGVIEARLTDAAGVECMLARSEVQAYPSDTWVGIGVLPELLATFVVPNDPAVAACIANGAKHLAASTGSPSFDGYQSGDPARVLHMAAAIYAGLQETHATYAVAPASFETEGQRVRFPSQIESGKLANCLDMALFAAAALEQAGLHPIVVIHDGHALAGVWLDAESFPNAALDDSLRFQKRVDLDEILVFDPTTATSRPSPSFDECRAIAKRRLKHRQDFLVAIDVHRARLGGVRPIGMEAPGSGDAEGLANNITGPASSEELEQSLRERMEALARTAQAESPQTRVDRWLRKLLDLTMRNRLLSCGASKRMVPLLGTAVGEIEDALSQGKSLRILPRPSELDFDRMGVEPGHNGSTMAERLGPMLAEGLRRGELRAEMAPEALDKIMLALYREARTANEEGGSSSLFLAVGFLDYYEDTTSQKRRRAPLLLLPMVLKRQANARGFRLVQGGDEARINVTLLEFLERDHQIKIPGLDPLPMDQSGVDVPLVLRVVKEAIKDVPRWEVVLESALGLFSFAKFLLWRDLSERSDLLDRSALVKHLVETPAETFDDGIEIPGTHDLDTDFGADETLCPLSADSSQLAAIFAAAKGKNLVIEGPPGTGKSQTIANLVAHSLATGKTVLFVSEKMAALEVVHRRLREVGLGEACLELHSNKANKKAVLEQLREALEIRPGGQSKNWGALTQQVDAGRAYLNRHVDALHRDRHSGEAVHDVLARFADLSDAPALSWAWGDPRAASSEQLALWRAAIDELTRQASAQAVGPGHALLAIGQRDYSPKWDQASHASLDPLAETADGFIVSAQPLSDMLCDGFEPVTDAGFTALLQAARASLGLADYGAALSGILTGWAAGESDESLEASVNWIEQGRVWNRLHGDFDERYRVSPLDLDLAGLETLRREMVATWFLPAWSRKRKILATMRGIAKQPKRLSIHQCIADLDQATRLSDIQASLEKASGEADALFGSSWRGTGSDWDALDSEAQRLRDLQAILADMRIAETSLAETFIGGLLDLRRSKPRSLDPDGALDMALREIEAARANYEKARATSLSALEVRDTSRYEGLAGARLLQRAAWNWSAAWGEIRGWLRYQQARTGAIEAGLERLVDGIESGQLGAMHASKAFERAFATSWCLEEISADEALRAFDGNEHSLRVQGFAGLDAEYQGGVQGEVRERIVANAPNFQGSSAPKESELGILQRELAKKSRHMAIRRLMKETSGLTQRLKPCFLMSPMSVAQYLDPDFPSFDLVLFDEASQIPVWDAVGALARGKQAVVVGDPKQLPPTSFFNRSEDETVGEDQIEDLESILDELIGAQVPTLRLAWHYRSRHESLIAFSNQRYYDGELLTFPSNSNQNLGVSWRYQPNGVYDMGGARTNEVEARSVVDEVVRRLSDPAHQGLTIGVVTFSQPQQTLVQDMLDAAQRSNPGLEPFFAEDSHEGVFVKNLENVQGDERDVILFSVGYGPDHRGRLSMNFGPLNKSGGERRLNVAVTRARREVVVFASLRSEQIDLDRTNARGMRDFRAFLRFAEKAGQGREQDEQIRGEPVSGIVSAIADALESQGYAVDFQVGRSSYRLDLAVRDPENPGEYLLGIETDGPNYASAATARDRDVLRSSVLQGLGCCLLYTSPSPRDLSTSRMPSSA